EREQLLCWTIDTRAPQDEPALDLHEADGCAHVSATHEERALEDRLDAYASPERAKILIRPLIGLDRRARRDAQRGNERESLDDFGGQRLSYILGFVVPEIAERQYGDAAGARRCGRRDRYRCARVRGPVRRFWRGAQPRARSFAESALHLFDRELDVA